MIKCIAWDLDDTIWYGTYDSNDSLKLNEDIIELVKYGYNNGLINVIVSKNHQDLIEPILKELNIEKYFVIYEISWKMKYISLRSIAERLNIGTDSILFIDVSEFELYQAKYYIPDINILNSRKIKEIKNILLNNKKEYDTNINRVELYKNLEERKKCERALSRKEFLSLCKIEFKCRKANLNDMLRITELSNRTNQFNSTSRRLTCEEVEEAIQKLDVYVCELSDIFGEYGVVGFAIIKQYEGYIHIQNLAISCRAEGKNVSISFINFIVREYKEYKRIVATFDKTEKNRKLHMLFLMAGFSDSQTVSYMELTRERILNERGQFLEVNSELQKIVRDTIEEISGVKIENTDDDLKQKYNIFFDSILFYNLIAEIETKFSVKIPVESIMPKDTYSINALTEHIANYINV